MNFTLCNYKVSWIDSSLNFIRKMSWTCWKKNYVYFCEISVDYIVLWESYLAFGSFKFERHDIFYIRSTYVILWSHVNEDASFVSKMRSVNCFGSNLNGLWNFMTSECWKKMLEIPFDSKTSSCNIFSHENSYFIILCFLKEHQLLISHIFSLSILYRHL
jgi:hypothetical protein